MSLAEDQSMAEGTNLRVAAAQMKFADCVEGNLAKIRQVAIQAARRRADVVLFPECAVTGYNFDFARLTPGELDDALTEVGQIAAKSGVNLLVGSPVFKGRKLYNALVHFDRQGQVAYCYAKCHLTGDDQQWFTPGNAIALFEIDGVPVTTVICHERRYPELARLAVMAGARIVFHPNAGMDALAVSKKKRNGNDGIAARAFENAVYYVFANSVGPQGGGKWSAGDTKIVAPSMRVLKQAGNTDEELLVATLDMAQATGIYAERGLVEPSFLRSHWKKMVADVKSQSKKMGLSYRLPNKRQ